jgi:hypothetical protein
VRESLGSSTKIVPCRGITRADLMPTLADICSRIEASEFLRDRGLIDVVTTALRITAALEGVSVVRLAPNIENLEGLFEHQAPAMFEKAFLNGEEVRSIAQDFARTNPRVKFINFAMATLRPGNLMSMAVGRARCSDVKELCDMTTSGWDMRVPLILVPTGEFVATPEPMSDRGSLVAAQHAVTDEAVAQWEWYRILYMVSHVCVNTGVRGRDEFFERAFPSFRPEAVDTGARMYDGVDLMHARPSAAHEVLEGCRTTEGVSGTVPAEILPDHIMFLSFLADPTLGSGDALAEARRAAEEIEVPDIDIENPEPSEETSAEVSGTIFWHVLVACYVAWSHQMPCGDLPARSKTWPLMRVLPVALPSDAASDEIASVQEALAERLSDVHTLVANTAGRVFPMSI